MKKIHISQCITILHLGDDACRDRGKHKRQQELEAKVSRRRRLRRTTAKEEQKGQVREQTVQRNAHIRTIQVEPSDAPRIDRDQQRGSGSARTRSRLSAVTDKESTLHVELSSTLN